MYLCQICKRPSKPGEPLRKHILKKRDGNIAREIPICDTCRAALHDGIPLAQLLPPAETQVMPTVPGPAVGGRVVPIQRRIR